MIPKQNVIIMSRNFLFKGKPPDDYFCPVSTELLVDANQSSCCGSHLSEQVASVLEKDNKPCPICNAAGLRTTTDLYFRRIVGQVEIFCQNKSFGCKWEGCVNSLDKHLGYVSVEGECKYVEVACPLLCGKYVKRRRIQAHMKEDCPKRPYQCNYCDHQGSHSSVINDHLLVCEKFPTRCPSGCDELLCRSEVERHVATVCRLQAVKCEFEPAGCMALLCRKDLEKHMDNNIKFHLEILAGHSKRKDREFEALKAQVQVLTNLVATQHKNLHQVVAGSSVNIGFVKPPTMTLQNFQELRRTKNDYWTSPVFYSHIGGYKMCLVVYPGAENSEFVGVYLKMLEGKYDDMLTWPFRGKVEIRMVNSHESDTNHIDKVLLDASSYSMETFRIKMVDRVNRNDTSAVWGCGSFIALKDLPLNKATHTQYLKDDCIKFQILNVSLLEGQ